MPDLTDAARDLVNRPIRPAMSMDILARRVRIRRRRRRLGAVLAAGVLVLPAGLDDNGSAGLSGDGFGMTGW